MKRITIIFGTIVALGTGLNVFAEDHDHQMMMGSMEHHQMMQSANDPRISLGLSAQMKQHQLSNMRSHLEALQSIVGDLAEDEFDRASDTAHAKLGLTPEMQKMCSMFENDQFRKMGLAFHQSGDALGDALKSRDKKKSLLALKATMNYCVQCHASYRQ